MTTPIAILGSGRVATSLARGLAKGGHDIVVGVRQPDTVKSWDGPQASFVSPLEAIVAADVIFNATPGDGSVDGCRQWPAP